MTDIAKDNNQIPTISGVLNTNGTTPTPIQAIANNHNLMVSDGTTGSDFGADDAVQDNNGVRGLMAVSKIDGTTPVTLYVNSSGQLLIDTT